jgi:pimeloyl-ACP methyl ester carboxylesterase
MNNNNLTILFRSRLGLGFVRLVSCAVFTAFFITYFISPITSLAQEISCGSIRLLSGEEFQVEDCSNPFAVGTGVPIELIINNLLVADGGVVFVEGAGTENYYIDQESLPGHFFERFFHHDENGYQEVETGFLDITEEDYQNYARAYFGNDTDGLLYVEAMYNGNFDEENPLWSWDTFDDFNEYFYRSFNYRRPVLPLGTYTAVIESADIQVTQNNKGWFKSLKDFLVPVAYAQSSYWLDSDRYSITFTIANEPAPLSGPPSLLFLPGIMGSRLYEESEECNLFGGVDKVERWFSAYDCDIERLLMDVNGESVNDIFTETDGVIERVVGQDLYKSFMTDLEDWKINKLISDYRAVPYDWRLSLYEILKAKEMDGRISSNSSSSYKDGYIYKSLEAMVAASPGKRVVLVGHSNGGLVIKTLLATMKENNDPLLSSIDKVVFVAVPQIGTPESVAGLLHGVEIGRGLVLTKEQSRKILNTAPFGYHLLPTDDYYDEVATPVIKFEAGTSTDAWITQFGAELDSLGEVTAFIQKESGRLTPDSDDTITPATAYSHLIGYANSVHNYIKDWRPASTSIYQVAGIGINTPATINYFSNFACLRSEIKTGGVTHCIESGTKLGYRVEEVIDGDGTVLVPSALTANGYKYYADLKRYSELETKSRIHKDILEVPEVRELISQVAASITPGTFEYISTAEPNLSATNRLVYRLHSPLDLYVLLSDGGLVGSSTPDLRGVSYRRYGEVQQLSIPEEEEGYEIILNGLATGSFTFEIDEYQGNNLEGRITYSAIPSATSTMVSYKEGEESLAIDYQGDGIFEAIAVPGLSNLLLTATTSTSSPSTDTTAKSNSSGTKVKDRNLVQAPVGVPLSGTIELSQRELMLELVRVLIIYRDLLISINVKI